MENNEIKAGDRVRLNSEKVGSFTVGKIQEIDGLTHAELYWFDHTTKEIKTKHVPIIALIRIY